MTDAEQNAERSTNARIDESIGRRLRALETRLEELAQDHNSLAHLFAATDRFSRARTRSHALDIAEEVLHNLVGAQRYAIWLVVGEANAGDARCVRADRMVADFDGESTREEALRCIATGEGTGAGNVPMCVPLDLDGETVGALYVGALVPHLGGIEQLQRDLIALVASTLAHSIVLGSAREERSARARWDALTI